MFSIFKKKHQVSNDINYKPGAIFGISRGTYLGEFFVYIEHTNTHMCFLSLPKMLNRSIPHNKFTTGIESGVLEFQENLPTKIKQICVQQYTSNEKKPNH